MSSPSFPESEARRPWRRALESAVAVGAAIYIAARFSDKGGLINVGFYLALAAFILLAAATRGRIVAELCSSRLAASLTAYALALAYAVLIAPDPEASWHALVPAHGRALVTALFVGCAASRAENARYLLLALAGGAVGATVAQFVAHVGNWQKTGSWIPGYSEPGFSVIRRSGNAHAFLLSAMIAMIVVLSGWRNVLLLVVIAGVETLALLVTGYRGAWLGVAVAGALAAAVTRQWKVILGGTTLLVTAGLALIVMSPGNVVSERLAQGFDTTFRTTGTWGPAIDLIKGRPLTGYGYGQEVFRNIFDAAAPVHPEWSFRSSLGPHNIYLSALFAGGPILLGAMLWVFAEVVLSLARAYRSSEAETIKALALAAVSAFVAAYLVQGLFEDLFWPPFGILVGIALGLHASSPPVAEGRPSGALTLREADHFR